MALIFCSKCDNKVSINKSDFQCSNDIMEQTEYYLDNKGNWICPECRRFRKNWKIKIGEK